MSAVVSAQDPPDSRTVAQRDQADGSGVAAQAVLVGLFLGSGFSALVYEIIWLQMLKLVIGSSSVSMAVLLGTFMGGMCLGSLLLPWLVSARRHPLRVYALLEAGIGLCGVAILQGMPWIEGLYTRLGASPGGGFAVRAVICALCLLPPTILMGATLPAISRWTQGDREGVSWLGLFYGANIGGAVAGCLVAGFYLLRVFDLATGTMVALSVNLVVAGVALAGSWWIPPRLMAGASRRGGVLAEQSLPKPTDVAGGDVTAKRDLGEAPPASIAGAGRAAIYGAVGISGLTALGAEVVWTRLLSLMLGATVYTFSIILAVFLLGLGIGSSLGAALARTSRRPLELLIAAQVLLACGIAWSAWMLTRSLPYWPIDPALAQGPWVMFQLDLMRALWALFPPTLFWGASFPLALAVLCDARRDAGQTVGRLYAANTLGAILGAAGFSLFAIRWLGTWHAQQTLLGLTAANAVLLALVAAAQPARRVTGGVLALIALATLALLAGIPPAPPGLVAFGRTLPLTSPEPDYHYVAEGANASVAISETWEGARNFHVSGKVVASSEPQDMRLQRMLGHLPALAHPAPKSVLVVGCGAGVTAGTFVLYPGVERIVICEIEPLIPAAADQYFAAENHGVVRDPRVEVVYDDARHFIAATDEQFDIITSDPIHPWVKGAAALYSAEYFRLCQRRLRPGGIVTQWVPLYESTLAAVKSELATFFEVFPEGTAWGNEFDGEGYDLVLMGSAQTQPLDVDAIQERLAGLPEVTTALTDADFPTALSLLRTYAGRGRDLRAWLADAELNRDTNLRLQYLAGLGLNSYQAPAIYSAMVKHRHFPEDLLPGASPRARALRVLLSPKQQESED